MGVIVHVSAAATSAGTVAAGMVSATVVNNDGALTATNSSTLTTSINTVNAVVDWEVVVQDSGGTTEYFFTDTVQNTAVQSLHGYWMRLGFLTGTSFEASNTSDLLDFDTSGVLGDPDNFAPVPLHTFPPEGIPVATTFTSNELVFGTGTGFIYATPVTGVHTVTFSLDVPDYNAFIPASAQITGGYRFTLRQFGFATAVVTEPEPEPVVGSTYAYAWVR